MNVKRLAIAILLLMPAVTFGQARDDRQDRVSNDDPARPLQMPPASTETKEALDDFERFQRRGAWERALKALYTIPDDQAARFVDGEDGFIIPVARRRRSILAALPPAGQAACRLFHDADAKKLLDEAEGASEQKNLERVYSAYFITSVGDNAADRLGDLYFEQGRFDRAADCWLSVLRERPDTDLSPATLAVKAGLALWRAGRSAELEQVRSELSDRYRDQTVTIAGRSGPAADVLGRLIAGDAVDANASGSKASADAKEPILSRDVEPSWQFRLADSVEAGMTAPELAQWQSNSLSVVVPAVAIGGRTLFVNFLGHILALDLESGKILWRTESFHNLELLALQPIGQALDPTRFAIAASSEYVWVLARDMKDQNMVAPFLLSCRRADNGEVVWRSSDLSDYASLDLVGEPFLAGGRLYCVAKTFQGPNQPAQGLPQQSVLAIQPHDGRVVWKTEVGTFREVQPYYYYRYFRESTPQPRLLYQAGMLYIDTHKGILGRLDAETGALDWGFGYRTDPVGSSERWFYQPPGPTIACGPPVVASGAMLIKGIQSERIYSLDADRMKVGWERPITKLSRLVGTSGHVAFLGGEELTALDLKTRTLLWAARLPGGSLESRVVVRPDGLWQLTPRGIFEVDPTTGDVRRIFRGKDPGSAGGDLVLTDRWLLAVSNRSISAYPRRAETSGSGSAGTVPRSGADGAAAATTKQKASP